MESKFDTELISNLISKEVKFEKIEFGKLYEPIPGRYVNNMYFASIWVKGYKFTRLFPFSTEADKCILSSGSLDYYEKVIHSFCENIKKRIEEIIK